MVTIKPRAPRVHAWSTTPGDSRAAAFVEAPPGSNEWFLALADVDKDAKSAESTLVVLDMMPLASFPSTVSWLGANDDGLLVCALADGTLGLAQPINFSLKHDDAPKFNETMTLDSPAIETRTRVLDAASSLLAVLSADKLRVFAAKKGDKTVLNDANLKIFEFENACSCDFSCDALNNLVVLTRSALFVADLASLTKKKLADGEFAGGCVVSTTAGIVVALQVGGAALQMLNPAAPDVVVWRVPLAHNILHLACSSDGGIVLCVDAAGNVLCISVANGIVQFEITSDKTNEMEMAIDAQWSSLSRRAFSIVRKNFSSTLYEVTENDGSFTYKELAAAPNKPSPQSDNTAYEPGMGGGYNPYSAIPCAEESDLRQFKKVKFADFFDPAKRSEAVAEFSRQMKDQSYAVVTMSDEMLQVVRNAESSLEQFYNSSKANKDAIKIEPGRDVGYRYTENVKEFFQMRKTDIGEFPWPNEPTEFPSNIQALWNGLDNMSRILMVALAEGLQLPPNTFEEALLDPKVQPSGTFSHTIMGMYNYFQHVDPTESCLVHKDMGLISIIPRAVIAGLEVLDYNVHKWVKAEELVADRNDCCVIGCQTLDRLTGSYYPANVHRVINTTSRKSIVYKLRARSDALLDMQGLNSPVLQKLFRYWPPALTVKDWILTELHYDDSVNFPGAALQNYKKCILDPSLNTSIVDKFGQRKD